MYRLAIITMNKGDCIANPTFSTKTEAFEFQQLIQQRISKIRNDQASEKWLDVSSPQEKVSYCLDLYSLAQYGVMMVTEEIAEGEIQ